MEVKNFELISEGELDSISGGNFWHEAGKTIFIGGVTAGVSVLTGGNVIAGIVAGGIVGGLYNDAVPCY